MSNYLVLGGTSGVGAAIAGGLKKNGHSVVIVGRRKEADLQLDLTKQEEIMKLGALPGQFDGVACCLGTLKVIPFIMTTDEDFWEHVNTNLYAAAASIRVLIRSRKISKNGNILCISSAVTQKGGFGLTLYAMAKAGLEGLVRNLALEIAPLKINAVSLGTLEKGLSQEILNKMTPEQMEKLKKQYLLGLGKEESYLDLAIHLLSQNTWMTGQAVILDGGYSLH